MPGEYRLELIQIIVYLFPDLVLHWRLTELGLLEVERGNHAESVGMLWVLWLHGGGIELQAWDLLPRYLGWSSPFVFWSICERVKTSSSLPGLIGVSICACVRVVDWVKNSVIWVGVILKLGFYFPYLLRRLIHALLFPNPQAWLPIIRERLRTP